MKSQLLWAAVVLGSCATPGANPHDMSTVGHEASAAEHQRMADEHASRYRPGAVARRSPCGAARHRGLESYSYDVCWSSVLNPTDWHLSESDAHRKHADDHRAASAALRAAEEKSCAGIAVGDRDMSPFEHREDISNVAPMIERTNPKGVEQVIGARVTFRAVEGMTAEWLQRTIDCHLARNASLGHVVAQMPDCPLVPHGVSARVSSAANGFAVEIRSSDPETAREIIRRSQRSGSAAASAPASQR